MVLWEADANILGNVIIEIKPRKIVAGNKTRLTDHNVDLTAQCQWREGNGQRCLRLQDRCEKSYQPSGEFWRKRSPVGRVRSWREMARPSVSHYSREHAGWNLPRERVALSRILQLILEDSVV